MTEHDLSERLCEWIQNCDGPKGRAEVRELRPVSGGNARSAYAFDVVWEKPRQSLECILLIQAAAGQLEQDLGPEFRILELIAKDEIPSPAPLWFDPTGRWLGSPGFVMERVRGEPDLRGLLDPSKCERNRQVGIALAKAAARLHEIDWQGRGFDAMEIPDPATVASDQVARWEALFRAHRMEALPAMVDAFHWLKAHAPTAERITLVHGDLRFGNLLYEGHELTALLDWEMAHLGDPCEDLAWAYHPIWSPAEQLPFEDFVAAYRSACDVPVPDQSLRFYLLFTEIKHAVISLTGAHAFASGESRNLRLADRMTWVPECLTQFYEWLPGEESPKP